MKLTYYYQPIRMHHLQHTFSINKHPSVTKKNCVCVGFKELLFMYAETLGICALITQSIFSHGVKVLISCRLISARWR